MRRDKKAVLDLPLRLMVVFLVVSITTPIAVGVVEAQEEEKALHAMEGCGTRISNNIVATHYNGDGSYRSMEIHLPQDCSISLGGELRSIQSFTMVYMYKGQPIGQKNIDVMAVPMVSINALMLYDGSILEMESSQKTEGNFVTVSSK